MEENKIPEENTGFESSNAWLWLVLMMLFSGSIKISDEKAKRIVEVLADDH